MPVGAEPAASSTEPTQDGAAEVGHRLGDGGRYELTSRIGTGGMGSVFAAHDHKLGCERAVKVLDQRYESVDTFVQRFRREAMATSRIGHINVVSVVDVSASDERPIYLVMELLDGQPLSRIVRGAGRLPWKRAHGYIDQIAAGLGAAHAHGVVHRDVKPGNCVVLGDGTVKVLDFGIAKITDADANGPALTAVGEIIGTCSYMAPEQIHGTVDQRSDVYALGALMFRLLTGRLPFVGTEYHQVLDGHLYQPPPRPSEHGAVLPEGVDEIVLTMLAKDPEQRFQTMDAVRGALAELAPGKLAEANKAPAAAAAPTPEPEPAASPPVVAASEPEGQAARRAARVTVRAGSGVLVDEALAAIATSDEFWEDGADPGAEAAPERDGSARGATLMSPRVPIDTPRGHTMVADDLPPTGAVARAEGAKGGTVDVAAAAASVHRQSAALAPAEQTGGGAKWIGAVVGLVLLGGLAWFGWTQFGAQAEPPTDAKPSSPAPSSTPAREHSSELPPPAAADNAGETPPSPQPMPTAAPGALDAEAEQTPPAQEPAPEDATPTTEPATPTTEPATVDAAPRKRKRPRAKPPADTPSKTAKPANEPPTPVADPTPASPPPPPAVEPKTPKSDDEPDDLRDPFG